MVDHYRIRIDSRWTLEDLYIFPRTYEQVYFLAYSFSRELEEHQVERVQHAFESFPWRGGYSAVNFYNQLKYVVPVPQRPVVNSMQYASPGVLDLGLVVSVAFGIAKLVKNVAGSIRECNSVYNEVITDSQKRKLLRLDVRSKELELSKDEMLFVENSADKVAKLLGFGSHQEVTERTGHPFITLKILLSYYRRIRKLAEYENKGKSNLPVDVSNNDLDGQA